MKKAAPVSPAGAAEVAAFLAKLTHPLKAEIEKVRALMRELNPAISEEIKWNSLGFRTTESFATVHLRSTDSLQLILHLGAKVRPGLKELRIADPAGLMKWLGKDRAMVTLGAGKTFAANTPAFREIVDAWIRHV